MKIGTVDPSGGRPPRKDDFNDLPRRRKQLDKPERDREALIGDPRNDENLIVAQMHVAFLRAHNRLLEEVSSPERLRKAKRRLRRQYQHIVVHDFLKQIAEPSIVDDIVENGNRIYDPGEDEFFMPLEFSVAAYRFGHSMVRAEYDYNLNFNSTGTLIGRARLFPELFMFTALSGQLSNFKTVPENWIIQWENFFRGGEFFNKARKIDTKLVKLLERLQTMEGQDEPDLAAKLAVRNLLRGYQLRMPTGQAVARALHKKLKGVRDIPVLIAEQIRKGAGRGEAGDKQRKVLKDSGFDERTPLWYYILAEAALLRDGRRLGGDVEPLVEALHPSSSEANWSEITRYIEGRKGSSRQQDGIKSMALRLAILICGGTLDRGQPPPEVPGHDLKLSDRIAADLKAKVPPKQLHEELLANLGLSEEEFPWSEFCRLADLGLELPRDPKPHPEES